MHEHSTIPPVPPKKKTGRAKTFSCPNCGGSVTVKAVGHSISAVCAYCSSVIDIANDNFRILSTAHERTRPTLLTLGNKGILAGYRWEIVGYLEKTDGSGVYRWDEYLLYNPYQGFRFLVQSQGHWSLFKVLKRSFANQTLTGELKFDGRKYERFHRGLTKVSYVKGEFYWRVRKGEESVVTDYISPPYTLSVDQTDDEINIALGEYIEPKKIEQAFVLSSALPKPLGVGNNQPGPYTTEHVGRVWFTAIAAFVLATIVQMAAVLAADKSTVFESSFTVEPQDKNQTTVTQSFSLPRRSNLLIDSYASLANDWLELDLALVDDKNTATKEAKQAMEFYTGTDYDGYYWSEGNVDTDTLFSAVPAGNYRLLIDADSGLFLKNQPVIFHVQIKRDVSSWSNYGITLLLILLYPVYVSIRYKYFESARWLESSLSALNWK